MKATVQALEQAGVRGSREGHRGRRAGDAALRRRDRRRRLRRQRGGRRGAGAAADGPPPRDEPRTRPHRDAAAAAGPAAVRPLVRLLDRRSSRRSGRARAPTTRTTISGPTRAWSGPARRGSPTDFSALPRAAAARHDRRRMGPRARPDVERGRRPRPSRGLPPPDAAPRVGSRRSRVPPARHRRRLPLRAGAGGDRAHPPPGSRGHGDAGVHGLRARLVPAQHGAPAARLHRRERVRHDAARPHHRRGASPRRSTTRGAAPT